jgi:uncharacterized membrane protein (UPF0127 family)
MAESGATQMWPSQAAVRPALVNRTKQVVLAAHVDIADTVWRRMKGLLGRTTAEFTAGKALWLAPCQGIHTIGMSFPIDAAYLDAKGNVVRTYHSLAPFRVVRIDFRTKAVVELPAGRLLQTCTEVGDHLEIA